MVSMRISTNCDSSSGCSMRGVACLICDRPYLCLLIRIVLRLSIRETSNEHRGGAQGRPV